MSNDLNKQILPVIRTKKGRIQYTGKIDDNTITIFCYGYCANFAKVLHQKYPKLLLSYVIGPHGEIDHWFCYDPSINSYYDITGKYSKENFYKYHNYSDDNCETVIDCELDEYYSIGMGEDKDDYLAENIILEYINKYNLK